jgi:hypothetical protein
MADWSKYTSELIYAYVHGHPFLPGTGPSAHEQATDLAEIGPGPWPWRPQRAETFAAASLLSAISLRVAASRMPGGPQKALLERTTDARIAELIDDYCGTPPGSPWPGPSPFSYGLAAGLSFLAGTLPQGSLQAAVEEVSIRVLNTALFEGTVGGPPTGGGAHGPGRPGD